jgi:hypothetical protein
MTRYSLHVKIEGPDGTELSIQRALLLAIETDNEFVYDLLVKYGLES